MGNRFVVRFPSLWGGGVYPSLIFLWFFLCIKAKKELDFLVKLLHQGKSLNTGHTQPPTRCVCGVFGSLHERKELDFLLDFCIKTKVICVDQGRGLALFFDKLSFGEFKRKLPESRVESLVDKGSGSAK